MDIAPLIRALWIAGINTILSCQATEPGNSRIECASAAEFIEFLNWVTRCEPGNDTFDNRRNCNHIDQMSTSTWFNQLNVLDLLEGETEQKIYGDVFFEATIGFYFPATDIPVLVEQLIACNAPA